MSQKCQQQTRTTMLNDLAPPDAALMQDDVATIICRGSHMNIPTHIEIKPIQPARGGAFCAVDVSWIILLDLLGR